MKEARLITEYIVTIYAYIEKDTDVEEYITIYKKLIKLFASGEKI